MQTYSGVVIECQGRRYPIPPGGLAIGRSPNSNLVLADHEVSRHHATIWVTQAGTYIRDEGSSNGTKVNGMRITAPVPIHAGDQIQIGQTILAVLPAGAADTREMSLTRVRPLTSVPARLDSLQPYPVDYNPDAYVEQNLGSNERLVLKAKLHWGMFVGPIVNIFLGIVLIALSPIGGQMVGDAGPGIAANVSLFCLACIALPVLLFGLLSLVGTAIAYVTTEFAVTNQRIIGKVGIVSRHSLELLLNKVETIEVAQPFWGRLLNYGTIVVAGGGMFPTKFPNIANPLEVRRKINSQITRLNKG